MIKEMKTRLRSELGRLYDLPFTTRTEDRNTYMYDVNEEFGLGISVHELKGKYVVLKVYIYGYMYGYAPNAKYLFGFVKTEKEGAILNEKAPWTLVSRAMSELADDKRWMQFLNLLKQNKFKKYFGGNYTLAKNKNEFGIWDEHFGETPLYLEAGVVIDATKYLQTKGTYRELVDELMYEMRKIWS